MNSIERNISFFFFLETFRDEEPFRKFPQYEQNPKKKKI